MIRNSYFSKRNYSVGPIQDLIPLRRNENGMSILDGRSHM